MTAEIEIKQKIHYVYYSYEEFGRGYIGSRTCPIGFTPEEDWYKGSFTDKTFDPKNKIIIETFETRDEANQAEIALHNFYDVARNPHFANKAKATSVGFCVIGTKLSEEAKARIRAKNIGKEPGNKGQICHNNGKKSIYLKYGEKPPADFSKGGLPISEEHAIKIKEAQIGENSKRTGQKCFTNGESFVFLGENEEIPKGYIRGGAPISEERRLRNAEKQKGEKSKFYGYKWCNNGIDEKRIASNDALEEGWEYGRAKEICDKISQSHEKFCWYSNGEIQIQIKAGKEIPEGFLPGKLPMPEETKQKLRGRKAAEETKLKLSKARRGMRYYNNGSQNSLFFSGEEPAGWVLGSLVQHTQETKEKLSTARKGKKWYNNGTKNSLFFPGEEPDEWVQGQLPKK